MPVDAIAACADDVAWPCRELGLERPVLVGHSAGGHIATQIAGSHADLPAAVVFLDSSLVVGPDRRNRIVEEMAALPQPVLTALAASILAWRADEVLAGCELPLLYIGSRDHPELDELRGRCPNFEYGQVVGTGHFLQLEVPDQVDAMIDRFLRTNDLPAR